jgi:hypothetical protein
MPGFFYALRCIGKPVVKNGSRALASLAYLRQLTCASHPTPPAARGLSRAEDLLPSTRLREDCLCRISGSRIQGKKTCPQALRACVSRSSRGPTRTCPPRGPQPYAWWELPAMTEVIASEKRAAVVTGGSLGGQRAYQQHPPLHAREAPEGAAAQEEGPERRREGR